jgi:Uma2 family endonuclease
MIAASQEKTIEKPVKRERLYSFEDYLKREEKAVDKHEFYNGQIVKMAGGKYRHNLISANVVREFGNVLYKLSKRYLVLNSDQKIYIEAENIGVYPDALVICEEPIFWKDREDILTNPLIVVKVLSRSTAAADRTTKFLSYQSLPSFQEYILINPNKSCAECFFKIDEDTWHKITETDLNKTIMLRSIGVTVSLSAIYERVVFPQK